jgi:hypothetical protein
MRKNIIIMTVVFLMSIIITPAWAAEDQHGGHGMAHDSKSMNHMDAKPMDNMSGMKSFKQQEVVDGIRAEFEVMRLTDMNMKDPNGNTHHIMVKFFKEGMDHPMTDVVGKIKVIGPDKKDQTTALKDYGGILAGNFTFKENGDYGVICLFKTGDKKHTVKFWYPHKE